MKAAVAQRFASGLLEEVAVIGDKDSLLWMVSVTCLCGVIVEAQRIILFIRPFFL